MHKKTCVIAFSYAGDKLRIEDLRELLYLYHFYHKKWWCYLHAFKIYQRRYNILQITIIGVTITGTVVGSVTMNPIILGVINGFGLLGHGLLKLKKYDDKISACKMAYSWFQSMLNKIMAFLRGSPYINGELNAELMWLDDITTDICPEVSKYVHAYDKNFAADKKMFTALESQEPRR